MRVLVILENSGGVLAREIVEVPGTIDTYDSDELDFAASNVIATFTLSIGDTIRIVDADQEAS